MALGQIVHPGASEVPLTSLSAPLHSHTLFGHTDPIHLELILEDDVYPNSTTILLDKLRLKIYLNSNNYSSMDQHVSTG